MKGVLGQYFVDKCNNDFSGAFVNRKRKFHTKTHSLHYLCINNLFNLINLFSWSRIEVITISWCNKIRLFLICILYVNLIPSTFNNIMYMYVDDVFVSLSLVPRTVRSCHTLIRQWGRRREDGTKGSSSGTPILSGVRCTMRSLDLRLQQQLLSKTVTQWKKLSNLCRYSVEWVCQVTFPLSIQKRIGYYCFNSLCLFQLLSFGGNYRK